MNPIKKFAEQEIENLSHKDDTHSLGERIAYGNILRIIARGLASVTTLKEEMRHIIYIVYWSDIPYEQSEIEEDLLIYIDATKGEGLMAFDYITDNLDKYPKLKSLYDEMEAKGASYLWIY